MVEEPEYETDESYSEPRSAKGVLAMIKDYEKSFSAYQSKADRIDKVYSSLQSLSGFGTGSDGHLLDREYNLFWASVEVIKPSIYSRAPVPVVVPKFKDRNPVKRVASEMLERTAIAGFDIADINEVMLNVRDDLVINARGVIWLSYETKEDSDGDYEKVCIEHLDRYDFGHEWGRKWPEVGCVWRHAWLTKGEARKRFRKTSGDAYQEANYGKHREELGDGQKTLKARFTEVWNKRENKVQWVADGVDVFLDEDEPHLKLNGFFPCPRPAYGTLERRSLVPVPDITYIQDQLETINELTVRIHDLCDKLVVKGIIPAGTEVGDAVEAAMREQDASYMLIPVPALSLSGSTGSFVEWLPIDQVAQAILAAVEARREIIGNVQELFGIADIMRGDTQAQETLGAQQLKAQFGSVRIRDRVNELVRIARDTVRIAAEIMAEEFSFDTLLDMSQMELPTDAEIKSQLDGLKEAARKELTALSDQAEQLIASPQAQQNPQAAEQQFQQAQQQIIAKYAPQIEKLGQTVTKDAVKKLLVESKTNPFLFDIETDSTIYPDEQAEKQSRNEFMSAFLSASQALAPLAMSGPAGAKMAGELIKFQLGPYRAGRQLEGTVDEWVESFENMPQQPNPEVEKAKADAAFNEKKLALDAQKMQGDNEYRQAELQLRGQELQLRAQEIAAKPQTELQKEQIKAEGNAQAKQLDAQVAVAREEAQLAADTQTTQMGLDAEAMLEAQRQASEDQRFAIDDQFRREELAIETSLEFAKLRQARETAAMNAQAKAQQPKGGNNGA